MSNLIYFFINCEIPKNLYFRMKNILKKWRIHMKKRRWKFATSLILAFMAQKGMLIFADHKYIFSFHIYVIVVEKSCFLWNCLEFFPLLRITVFFAESGGCVWKSAFQLKCRISFMSQGMWRQFIDSYSIIFLWQIGMIIIIVLRQSPIIKFIQH